MYVEDNSDKIIREAKIKAHGKCNRHMGHMNWDDVLGTAFIALFIGIATVIIATGVSYDHGKEVGKQNAQMEYTPTYNQPTQSVTKLKFDCTSKKYGQTSTVMTITNPGLVGQVASEAGCSITAE